MPVRRTFNRFVRPFLITFLLGGVPFFSACSSLLSRVKEEEKAKIYLQLSVDQLQERQYQQSIESCNLALKITPSDPTIYNQLALVYMETKRYEKSEEAFKKALELKSDFPEVLNNMGVLLNRTERYNEAITYFDRALKFESYSTPENALTNMGYSFFRLGNHSKSKALHQKALDIMPQFCLANKNMGDIYAKEKKFKHAVDYFDKAAVNCPLYQEAQYKLGLVLMKVGKRSVAKAHFEKLVERNKTGPYVERSHEVLKFLR